MVAPIVLSACGPTPEPQVIVETVVVEQTRVVEVEGTPQTIVETVQVEVTVPPPPTAEQLARAAALKRFNRLTIYLPVGLIVFVWLVLVLALLWLTVFGQWANISPTQLAYYRNLVRGIADISLIVFFTLLLILGMIPIILTAALVKRQRERRALRPAGVRPLPLMWRMENLILSIQQAIAGVLPMIARPVTNLHAAAAYVRALFIEIKKILTRS
jgi:hypothetical protein